jgi:Arc/MetJ family transcription regulator
VEAGLRAPLDENLVKEAFKYAGVKTKKDLIDLSLKEFIASRKRKNLSELKGKIRFADGYDYKAMRKEGTQEISITGKNY